MEQQRIWNPYFDSKKTRASSMGSQSKVRSIIDIMYYCLQFFKTEGQSYFILKHDRSLVSFSSYFHCPLFSCFYHLIAISKTIIHKTLEIFEYLNFRLLMLPKFQVLWAALYCLVGIYREYVCNLSFHCSPVDMASLKLECMSA